MLWGMIREYDMYDVVCIKNYYIIIMNYPHNNTYITCHTKHQSLSKLLLPSTIVLKYYRQVASVSTACVKQSISSN